MKISCKNTIVFLAMILSGNLYATGSCATCDSTGLPGASASKNIEKLANGGDLIVAANLAAGGELIKDSLFYEYTNKFCRQYENNSSNVIGLTIKEMEKSPYPIDEYFYEAKCQPAEYSNAVSSPIIHVVADDPFKNERKLETLMLYYLKKRKQPELFTKAINIQNTEGETLLDYIELLKQKKRFTEEALAGPVPRIIAMLCENGGIYVFQKGKSCPAK